VRRVGWKEEERTIIEEMVVLVDQQIGLVLEEESNWKIDDCVIAKFKNFYDWDGYGWLRRNITKNFEPVFNQKPQPPVDYPWHWQRDGHGWRNVHTGKRTKGESNYPIPQPWPSSTVIMPLFRRFSYITSCRAIWTRWLSGGQ
jgi:hypothetical protein